MFSLQGQVRESTHSYFSSRSRRDLSGVATSIKCRYRVIHTHTTLSVLSFPWEALQFLSFILTFQSACVSIQRAQEIMAVQWFCQRMVRVMIYQGPFINFSNANYGHESCFTLTGPFLTNVDLCMRLDWLMFQNCRHASPQRTRWLWWVLTGFFWGGVTEVYTEDNRKLPNAGMVDYSVQVVG